MAKSPKHILSCSRSWPVPQLLWTSSPPWRSRTSHPSPRSQCSGSLLTLISTPRVLMPTGRSSRQPRMCALRPTLVHTKCRGSLASPWLPSECRSWRYLGEKRFLGDDNPHTKPATRPNSFQDVLFFSFNFQLILPICCKGSRASLQQRG